jgi:uncharacterized protein (DUF2141 family)
MKHSLYKYIIVLLTISLFFNCARRGSPTGGAKDSIPPILVKAIPSVETINFKETKIKIYFDEYIKLKDVKKQLVISPPQKYEPIISPVGTASKFISIKILDTLDANTTYAFNFGKSIVDNNEENELGNFKYVFSTGNYIDSLSIRGKVTDPTVKKMVTGIDVLLYEYNEAFTDSIIYKQKPRYVANTLDTTLFEITNLKAGKYLLIALKDANGNKIYNPEIDKIGFVNDTVTIPTNKNFNFTIFKEIPKLLVLKPKEITKGHLIFGYQGNAKDISINLLTKTPANFKSHIIFEKNKDTINYWYTPFEADSLNFLVSNKEFSKEFTLKPRTSKIDSLKVQKSTNNVLHLLDTFSLATNTPIANFDTSKIKIIDQDSVNIKFTPIISPSNNKLYLNFDKKHNSEYNFELLPKAVTDIYEISNDSMFFKLKTKTPEDYGILNIEIIATKTSAFIVELLDDKNKLIRTVKIEKPGLVKFDFLNPGNYSARITIDENNNGIWDTGNFLEKHQPEVVKYFDKIIELRANWEVNETFSLD